MNRFALILPLLILAVLLGYFVSSLPKEWVNAVVVLAVGVVVIEGHLRNSEPKNGGSKQTNKKTRLETTFTAVTLFLTLVFVPYVRLSEANPQPVSSLKMPEEYINYTISRVNGGLWAKVDGTYPLYKFNIECKEKELWIDGTEFTFSGDVLPMVYPIPPGTTNLYLENDERELNWSNYTQIYPDATHYTVLGYWTMIFSAITVLDHFTLKIHYEHPIEMINGNSTFLYDLNISPYLSPWSNKSTANFNIRFETSYTNLQVNTVADNGALNPITYEVTEEDKTKVVTLQVVSEYSKPILGDLLISFTEDEETGQASSGYSRSSPPIEYVLVTVVLTAIVSIAGYLSLKHRGCIDKR